MDFEKETLLMGSVREAGEDILRNRVGMSSLTNSYNPLTFPKFMFLFCIF